jgi:ABC-2 type transport system permease protein
MNPAPVRAIVRKDIASVVRNRGVLIPLIVTPIIVLVILPVFLVGGANILAASSAVIPVEGATQLQELGDQFDSDELAGAGASPEARWTVFVLEVFLAPLFLLIPLIVATVIAADSFAGERERGTLEALLHTPTTDRELLAGKFLASWLPAVTVSTAGFFIYSVLVNALGWPALGRIFFPTPVWLFLAFYVAPGVAALGLGLMVIASSRVKSLQAAHQVGSLVVLPILLLLVAQVAGVLIFEPLLLIVMGSCIWAAAVVTLLIGGRSLRRQRLATRI